MIQTPMLATNVSAMMGSTMIQLLPLARYVTPFVQLAQVPLRPVCCARMTTSLPQHVTAAFQITSKILPMFAKLALRNVVPVKEHLVTAQSVLLTE